MLQHKLSHGLLEVLNETGPHYVKPSFAERLRLIWIFRNFAMLPQQVFTGWQQHLLASLCSEQRMVHSWKPGEHERGELIGTLVSSVFPPSERDRERRRGSRCPVQFEVSYGIGKERITGEGYDFGNGGLSFTGPTQFPPGTEFDLRYRLHPQDEWVSVRALVRHQEAGRMGVEFLELARKASIGRSTLASA